MLRRSSKQRAILAAMVLCAMSLTGCTQTGMCGQAITPAPRISVDVSSWVKAHPDTNVRVCAEGNCMTGYNVVTFTVNEPDTPPHDGDSIAITAESVQGSMHVESFGRTVQLVHDQCGQKGIWLRMDGKGRLSVASPE
jgi:predicted small secreted protein